MEKELADYVTQLEKQIATLRQGQLEAILTAKPDFWIDQFLKGYRALSTIREQTQTIVFDAILGTLKDFIPAYATKYTCLENGDANRHYYELEEMALDGNVSDEEYRDRMPSVVWLVVRLRIPAPISPRRQPAPMLPSAARTA